MNALTLIIFPLLTYSIAAVEHSQQSGKCPDSVECNCPYLQLKNVGILQHMVQSIVNDTFKSVQQMLNASIDERIAQNCKDADSGAPVIKMLYIVRTSSTLQLKNISGSNIGHDTGNVIATLQTFNPSTLSTSSNNILAYHPNYSGHHTSGLGAIFVNIEGVFPCVAGTPEYYPVCKIFTFDEDGFRNGQAIVDASDCGNHMNIFGSNLAVFGFAISGCSTMTTNCLPVSTEFSIVCLLPRSRCDG